MADSDFLAYSSIYDSFSKGPKSVYYGLGDEMLPGAILNVPQTDDDDEWGRTQRIGEERSYDFIATIYKTLFDPYNSIPDVSLIPGEAGSEINVAKNMIRLTGRSGIDTGVFDLSVPSLTLGDIIVNGSDNTIKIGSKFEANETSLTLNTNLIFSATEQEGLSTFNTVSTILHSFSGNHNFSISVNTKVYFFGESLLQLPTGGTLEVRGDLKTYDLIPKATTYNIGTAPLPYNKIYATDLISGKTGTIETGGVGSYFVCTNDVIPRTDGGTITFGHDSKNDTLDFKSTHFNIYSNSTIGATLSIYNGIMDIGDLTCNNTISINSVDLNVYSTRVPDSLAFGVREDSILVNRNLIPGTNTNLGISGTAFNNIWGNSIHGLNGFFTGILTTTDIYPTVTDVSVIGSAIMRFKEIYANKFISGVGLFSDLQTVESFESSWFICGPNLEILNNFTSTPTTIMNLHYNRVQVRVPFNTANILPIQTNLSDIGSAALIFKDIYSNSIYLKDQSSGAPVRVYVDGGVLHPASI